MNWRTTGGISLTTWKKELERVDSPIHKAGESTDTYNAVRKNPNLTKFCLAVLWHESQYGTTWAANPPENKNPLNMRPRGMGGFQKFKTYAECFSEWYARVNDPAYAYANTVTIEDFVNVYAPGWDNNNVAEYVNAILTKMRQYEQIDADSGNGGAVTKIDGLRNLDVDFVGRTLGSLTLTDAWITVHNTGNNVDRHAERGFFANGGGDQGVLVHFVLDETGITQITPLWSQGIHSGNYDGNRTSIAFEMTENREPWSAIEQNAVNLLAGLHIRDPQISFEGAEQYRFSLDRVRGHRDWPGANPGCPGHLIRLYGSNETEVLVKRARAVINGDSPNDPPTVKPHAVGHETTKDGKTFVDQYGNTWYWYRKAVRTKRTVQTYEYASTSSRKGPKLAANTTFTVYWLVATPSEIAGHGPEIWGTTYLGWRVPMDSIL